MNQPPQQLITQRRIVPERMDQPDVSREELERAFRFIEFVNRRLGATAAVLKHLQRWSKQVPLDQPIRVLDIGAGSADIPRAIAAWADKVNRNISITAIDNHETTLQIASDRIRTYNSIELINADALRLSDIFEPGTFDFAHAGMFLHHLEDIDLMTVLRIMQRLTTRGLIWNDLTRNTISRIGVRMLTIGQPEIVRNDAIVSVEKGFAQAEALEIAHRVGLNNVNYHGHIFGRFTLTSEH